MINFIKVEGKYYGDIILFALSTCGWCKKTKKFLEKNNVAFWYVYVDKLDGSELEECLQLQKQFSAREDPMVTIGENDCIVGYNIDKLNSILG